jgi:PAS domain S-box-containing protein
MRTGKHAEGRSKARLRELLSSFALLALLSSCPPAATAGSEKSKTVVFLYPDNNDGRPGNLLVDRGLRATFTTGSAEPIIIHNEYLDLSRPPNDGYRLQLATFLQHKYAGRRIDLVIAGLTPALDFALEHRDQIFPGVPVVFCAVDQREVKARQLPPDVVGIPSTWDLAATLDVALRLQSNTRHVFVIAGGSSFDAQWTARAREIFHGYEDNLEFTYLTGLPLNELLKEVAHLPDRSVIYYLHVFQDGTGKVLIPGDVLELLAATAKAPIYGHVDTYVGRGIVGGRVFSFEAEGKNAAAIGLRILAGEKPETISIPETGENTFVFDSRQLRRWGIGEGRLPPGSVVRHKEPDFWDLYKWHVAGVICLCVLQAVLIVGLLVQRASRRRAELRFRHVVEAAPNGMLMVGQDGVIVLANAQMEKLFGYRKEEMIGQPVEMLVPERFRKQHPAHRDRFFATPQSCSLGTRQDLFGRCKDGEEFPVEIGLTPVQTDSGLFVLASIIDITERKWAEEGLRASQRELRVLSGKLLRAQEKERRRIARDLHDDLNQSLALLSVELDLLSQTPPESAGQLGTRIGELSDRVKQLSSSVHDLSHRLHPLKLEQMGLVAAVRALCKEMSQSYGLPIEFTHGPMPEASPDDTALCLYRIVQEALRNVIKHSGARHAEVELSGIAEMIRLRIVDDGAGFDPRTANGKGGLGLISMRERLHLLGGEIVIEARPSGGIQIDVRVPLGATGQVEGPSPVNPVD